MYSEFWFFLPLLDMHRLVLPAGLALLSEFTPACVNTQGLARRASQRKDAAAKGTEVRRTRSKEPEDRCRQVCATLWSTGLLSRIGDSRKLACVERLCGKGWTMGQSVTTKKHRIMTQDFCVMKKT